MSMGKGDIDISRLILPIAVGAVALLFAAGAYFFLIAPKRAELATGGKYDLTALKQDIESDKAYATKLAALITSYEDLNSQVRQTIQAAVPVDVDGPGLMAAMDAIAQKHQMVLRSIDVSPVEDEIGGAGQATARISANFDGGDYQELKLLLADIERSSRLLDVTSIVFTPATSLYSVQLKAYYVKTPSVAPKK